MSNTLKTKPLAQCLALIIDRRGVTPKKLGSDWVESGYKTLSANNVKFSGLTETDSIRFVNEITYKKWMRDEIKKGDLLLTSEAPAGEVMYWDSDEKIVVGQRLFCLRTNDDVDSKFLKYYLQSKTGQFEINKNTSGSTVFGISAKMFEQIMVRLPEKREQEKIGSFLYSLDKKIEINNITNNKLEELAKTLYDYWFVQFNFPDSKEMPYKTNAGKMFWNEKLKREIPEGWMNGNFSSISNIVGGSTPSKKNMEYFTQEGTAWITPKDLSLNMGNKFITRGESDVSAVGLKAASLNIMPKGTVLLSSRAPIGYLAISRGLVTTNQGFKSLIPKQGFSTPFVYYAVKNLIPAIINNANGSTFKEISGSTLKMVAVCLPPTSIIEKYTEIANPIFEKQSTIELENQKLSALRDWLLPMLMNGQISLDSIKHEDTKN